MNSRFWFALLIALAPAACGKGTSGPDTRLARCVNPDFKSQGFVEIPAGSFFKGADAIYPEELPEVALQVEAFRLLDHEVTNDEFAAFVAATGYQTLAELSASVGGPAAGSAVFLPAAKARPPGWKLALGATWQAPEGPGSSIEDRGGHPAVHIALADARAYAAWAGGRLPTEVEWEYAARLGLPDAGSSTSGAFSADGTPVANTWQGIFPVANTVEDGFAGTSPAGCYPADRIGLHDMIGNVWEWTDTPYGQGTMTIKGGSYLCADNFCRRYRPAARQPEEADFSSNHIGFRIAKD